MIDFLSVSRALSDKNRVRALLALRGGRLCVCQLIELLGLAPSTVSKHMALLRAARLVVDDKDGRWVYYRLPGPRAAPAVRKALEWVRSSLDGSPQALEDARRLKKILKVDPEVLCRAQAKN